MQIPSLSRRARLVAILLAALVWFGLTVPRLTVPGLYYDEVIFVNAGLGGPLESFAQTRVGGWPMFIMPYIGALKSLIHAPFFALFGVNVWTLRLPSLLISFGTVLLLAGVARRLAGRRAFYLGLLLFVLDPALLWTSRTDFGPTTLASFFRALSLFMFLAWLGRGGRWRFLLLMMALLLGLWDKLNFVWFLGGLVAAGLLVYPKAILARFREGGLPNFGVAILGAGVGGYFLVERIWPLLEIKQGWFGYPPGLGRLRWLGGLFAETMDGRSIALFHFPGQAFPDGMSLWFLAFLGGMFLFVLAVPKGDGLPTQRGHEPSPETDGRFRRAPLFLLLLFILVSAQIFLTRQVGGLHHLMMLHPLPQLFGFALWGELAGAKAPLPRVLGRGLLGAGLLAWLLVSVRLDFAYLRMLSHPELENPKWSSAIFPLSQKIEAQPFDRVICTDWGLHAPLFSLASPKNRMRYWDLWPKFKTLNQHPKDAKWLQGEVRDKRVLVILHGEAFEEQKPARANALLWLKSLPGQQKHWTVKHGDGRILFEVFQITPKR